MEEIAGEIAVGISEEIAEEEIEAEEEEEEVIAGELRQVLSSSRTYWTQINPTQLFSISYPHIYSY